MSQPRRTRSLVPLTRLHPPPPSRGDQFPDGPGFGTPVATLLVSGEDALADTVLPRLRDLGADLRRVFAFRAPDDPDRLLTLPDDLPALERAVATARAGLVVL